jgi:hypothetical protein
MSSAASTVRAARRQQKVTVRSMMGMGIRRKA